MRDLLRCFLVGALAIGSITAVIWGWNHLFLPAWFASPVLRYCVLGLGAILFTTWVGALFIYEFAGKNTMHDEVIYVGDGVTGE